MSVLPTQFLLPSPSHSVNIFAGKGWSVYIYIYIFFFFFCLVNKLYRYSKDTSLLFRSAQSLSHVRLFATPWTAACQASLSITKSQSLLKLMSIESVTSSNHLSSSVIPFSSCLQSFLASGSFPMSQFFTSCGQNIGVSALASVLPVNTQD